MNLNLSANEYRKLVELTYLGEWLVNAQHDPDFHDESARAVLQKVLASYTEAGVEQDVETSEYYVTSDWAEQMYDQYILDYDDHVFWDELTERLAQRDLAKARGVELDTINRDDDLFDLRAYEERYHDELEEHGIERLEIAGDYQ